MRRRGRVRCFEVLTADASPIAAGEGVIVLKGAGVVSRALGIPTSGGTQGIQFGGELSLRLDERATVIAHRLVAGVGVLGHDGVDGGNQYQDQQNQSEHGIVDEEDNTHHTRDKTRLVEDLSEEEQEDGVKEVDGLDGDVVDVGFLVHPGTQHTDGDEHGRFDDDKGHRLHDGGRLAQTDEHALDEDIDEDRDDKVVGRRAVLHVQEAPLVQTGGVRVEDVGRVPVHGDGAFGEANNLDSRPTQCSNHRHDHDDGQNDLGDRITVGQFPKTQHNHLRETNQGQTEQDASSHDLPSITEVRELVTLHLAVLGEELANTLEDGHDKHDDRHEEDEEDQTGQEDVSLFNTGFESNTLDTTDSGSLLSGLL